MQDRRAGLPGRETIAGHLRPPPLGDEQDQRAREGDRRRARVGPDARGQARHGAHAEGELLRHDVAAGLVLATMLVPAGVAYATASGVPGIYGLYCTVIGLTAYALFGPSRILVLGPDSALAPIILAVVLSLAHDDPNRAVVLASMMAVIAGLVCVMIGVYWDISWHMSIGRDSFWTPAHLLIQAGGLIAGLTSGYVAIRTTFGGSVAAHAARNARCGARASPAATFAPITSMSLLVRLTSPSPLAIGVRFETRPAPPVGNFAIPIRT